MAITSDFSASTIIFQDGQSLAWRWSFIFYCRRPIKIKWNNCSSWLKRRMRWSDVSHWKINSWGLKERAVIVFLHGQQVHAMPLMMMLVLQKREVHVFCNSCWIRYSDPGDHIYNCHIPSPNGLSLENSHFHVCLQCKLSICMYISSVCSCEC